MTLNSLDVQNKTFNPQFRGFNKHEVDEFLDMVVRDYDEFAQKLKDQERELKSLRERVKYFDEMKDSLNKSIVVAQDAADNLKAQAEKEASGMIADADAKSQLMVSDASIKSQAIIDAAKKEASLILNAASDDARELARNTDDLKRKMRLYHQRMTSLIESQLASTHAIEWDEILQPHSNDYLINPEEKLQEIIEKTAQGSTEVAETTESEVQESVSADENVAPAKSEESQEKSADTEASATETEAISEASQAPAESEISESETGENSLGNDVESSQASAETEPVENENKQPEGENSAVENSESDSTSETNDSVSETKVFDTAELFPELAHEEPVAGDEVVAPADEAANSDSEN